MRIVKTYSGYKIKFGWWIFSSYLQRHPFNIEGYLSRNDAVFQTYEEARVALDNYLEMEGY